MVSDLKRDPVSNASLLLDVMAFSSDDIRKSFAFDGVQQCTTQFESYRTVGMRAGNLLSGPVVLGGSGFPTHWVRDLAPRRGAAPRGERDRDRERERGSTAYTDVTRGSRPHTYWHPSATTLLGP